ncbi:MAG: endonuclease/exonuclease/phosphatase family protein [Bacteroidales bacterium]|nr:endonuclease/exonuclease/phosphatase family protein [Bacteroidales bacterium]
MKRFVFILIAFLPLLSCVRECGKEIVVMTYNVGVFGKYTENSTGMVADIIDAAGADVVALNELDSCNRRHNTYQVRDLADSLGGWSYSFAKALQFKVGSYGNGVVSRLPILKSAQVLLPLSDGAEVRSMAVVETEDYVLASTHFDHVGTMARVEQARFITDWFKKHYSRTSKPVFLCGDMNSRPDDPALVELLESWTMLSGTEFTCPNIDPYVCIDYIFCLKSDRNSVEVLDYVVPTVETMPDVAVASDHLPVYVRLKVS